MESESDRRDVIGSVREAAHDISTREFIPSSPGALLGFNRTSALNTSEESIVILLN